ncbi:hypothetical protein AAA081_06215 [Aedoeadaptatus acetigenes]|uniref:Uncharacterized protein n=1 Tax=Aedoeadaptatus acetigenes TaxID=2981723 RepID=A0ABV1J6R0_9FIRM
MKSSLKQLLLGWSGFIAINRRVLKVLGLDRAYLLSILAEGEEMFSKKGDDEGWFYQTVSSIENMSGFSQSKQYRLLKEFEDMGILSVKFDGFPQRRYLKLHYDVIEKIIFEENEQAPDDPVPKNNEVKMNEQGLQNDCSEDSYSQNELSDQSNGMTRSVKQNDQISQNELSDQSKGMTRSVKKTALYNKESRDKESINLKHSINNPHKEEAEGHKKSNSDDEKNESDSDDKITNLVFFFTSNFELQDALFKFIAYRKELGAAITPSILPMFLEELKTIGSTEKEMIAVLNQSMINGWKRILPVNQKNSAGHAPKTVVDEVADFYEWRGGVV